MKKILFVLGIILVLTIYGCQKTSLPENGETIVEKDTCQEWAKTLIPNTLILYERFSYWELKDLTWNDDKTFTPWDGTAYKFQQGNKEGQNINYYYPTSTWDQFSYETEDIISEEGYILGKNKFKVSLILKLKENGSEGIFHGASRDYPTKEFEVVQINFDNCEMIQE